MLEPFDKRVRSKGYAVKNANVLHLRIFSIPNATFRSIFLFFLYQQLLQKALNAAFPVMAQHLLFKRNTGDTMEIASERGVAEKKLRVKKLF